MTTVASGIIVYPSGGESASYVIPIPAEAAPGDVLMMKIDTAAGATVMNAAPSEVTTFFGQSQNPSANHRDCGLYGYEVAASPPVSVAFTFPSAVRGNAVWWLARGVTLTGAQSSITASWQSNTTTVTAPSITGVPAGAFIYGGLSYGSGSAVVNPPASPWVTLQDAGERRGFVASKGVQATAGSTGAATFGVPAATNAGRAWQLALPEPPIIATLETEAYPGFTGDVADGAAIYPNGSDSLILATNKATGGGLYVLGLDGQIVSSTLGFAADSVDWRVWDGGRVLVLTVDRDTNQIKYFWLNPTTKTLTAAGTTTLAYEPYGSCLYVHSNGNVYAFISDRGADDFGTHSVRQYLLTRSGETVSAGSVVRTITADGVMEGMAADDTTGVIFVSREDHGLYRYSAAPGGSTTPTTVDTVGAGNLVADVEDVAIARHADGDKLLVSSQGDSSYHVYNLATLAHEQRFTIARPGGSTSVLDTDGLDVLLTPMGAFTDGLIVVHDGGRTPTSGFAFVDAALVFGDLPPGSNTGTLNASPPKLTASIMGQSVNTGTLAAKTPKLTAALTAQSVNVGTLNASMPRVTGSVTGASSNAGILNVTVAKATASVTGASVNVGTLNAATPLVTSQIADVVTNHGTLNGTAPRLTGALTGRQ